MKSIIIFFTFFLLALKMYSQEMKSTPSLTSEEYLEKSKSQYSTGWFLLGIGTAGIVGSIAVASGSEFDLNQNGGTVGALLLLGITLDIISIPVFVSADKNKKLAMEAVTTIKFEEVPSWSGGAVRQSNVPTVSIQVRF